MKLIEHLEHVLGLVERRVAYLEIKSALLAMHQEIEGYEKTAAEQIRLTEMNSTLKADKTKLEAELARRESDDAVGGEHAGGWIDPNLMG